MRDTAELKEMRVTSEVCLSASSCAWQPFCLFVHPEGGNDQQAALRRNTVPRGNREEGEVAEERRKEVPRCKSGEVCSWKPRCRFGHPEGGNQLQGEGRVVARVERRVAKVAGRRRVKECRAGPACSWKPRCLFLHQEGGNDHDAAFRNFSPKKGKEEKVKAKVKVAKVMELKFQSEGGSSFSDMQAWCHVARRVNKEALLEVNYWHCEHFVKAQVELLGGSRSLYEEVDDSLKELELVEDLEEEQRALYNWRMDFFLDKFKSTYLGDNASTWITDGFDDNHSLDTIPMQVTLNFDEVMRLAATNKALDEESERFYFAHDENLSYVADQKFGRQEEEEKVEVGEKEVGRMVESFASLIAA